MEEKKHDITHVIFDLDGLLIGGLIGESTCTCVQRLVSRSLQVAIVPDQCTAHACTCTSQGSKLINNHRL